MKEKIDFTDIVLDKTHDGRYLLFNRDPVQHLWFPDVYIHKAKELRVPVYKIPPAYLRIYETGLMMYSARVNYDLSCPMVFDNYPVDEQVCDIVFERCFSLRSRKLSTLSNLEKIKTDYSVLLGFLEKSRAHRQCTMVDFHTATCNLA